MLAEKQLNVPPLNSKSAIIARLSIYFFSPAKYLLSTFLASHTSTFCYSIIFYRSGD